MSGARIKRELIYMSFSFLLLFLFHLFFFCFCVSFLKGIEMFIQPFLLFDTLAAHVGRDKTGQCHNKSAKGDARVHGLRQRFDVRVPNGCGRSEGGVVGAAPHHGRERAGAVVLARHRFDVGVSNAAPRLIK